VEASKSSKLRKNDFLVIKNLLEIQEIQNHLIVQKSWEDEEIAKRVQTIEAGLFSDINSFKTAQNEMVLRFL
jgi:hypothetical protein